VLKTVRTIVLALVALASVACGSAPLKQDVVSAVDITGGEVAEEKALEAGLATREDAVFDADVLTKDLVRIQRFYRAHGYYEASIRAARVVRVGKQKVRVEVDVSPGTPVLVSKLELVGIATVSQDLQKEVTRVVRLRKGERLVEAHLHDDARAVEHALADAGFAFAKVVETAEVSVMRRTARVRYAVTPGRQAVYGDVRLEGLGEFDEGVVRDTLGLQKGEPYSKRQLDAARKRLFELGVFSTVSIEPDLGNPASGAVPLRVKLEPGATHSVHFGAVIEQDSVRAMAGLRLGWESRNFFGNLRKFTVDATPGVTFYPLANPDVPLKALPSVLSSVRLEQPAIIDALTTGFIQSNVNAQPVLYSEFNPGDNIIGFFEVGGSVGAERQIATEALTVRPSYNAQASFPYMYLGQKPEGLDRVLIFFPEIVGEADFRDDPIEPRSGAFVRLGLQVAGSFFGDAQDVRLEPELRLYAKISRRVSIASRTQFGFLLPNLCADGKTRGCYGDSLTLASTTPADNPVVVRDQQLLLFRGFYSGGATSNRGYNLREVGPHGALGFLVPSNVNCAVPDPPERCIHPLGGLTLWEQSLELRILLSDLAGLVFFVDASDVTRERVTFRADYPHLSTGSGFRLRTPVGAVRLDVGLRVPYMQSVGEKQLPTKEGNPDTILGAPLAFHFGLGEAF